jgi:O-antigen/teichoic acid export membrane protein
VLNAIGKIRTTLKLMVMWTILTWTITPVAMYFWGFEGVAWSAAIVAISSIVPVIIVKHIIPFQFFDQIWRQLLGAFAMIFVGWMGLSYWGQSYVNFVGGMVLCGLTYVLVTVALGPRKCYDEIRSLKS